MAKESSFSLDNAHLLRLYGGEIANRSLSLKVGAKTGTNGPTVSPTKDFFDMQSFSMADESWSEGERD